MGKDQSQNLEINKDHIKKEALFNEVKGSLFEYLVARNMCHDELSFIEQLPANYLTILSQQDRMVRQFYPEMHPFLKCVSDSTSGTLRSYLSSPPTSVKLIGKCSDSRSRNDNHEADLVLEVLGKELPVSLKLNKQNAYVNTKSGGIKSFFSSYFRFLGPDIQNSFNSFVDQEFVRMAHEIHALNDMSFEGDFNQWVDAGKSELPGELNSEESSILKSFYRRVASKMHEILSTGMVYSPQGFRDSLPPLLGFSSEEIIQVVCFHDFGSNTGPKVRIHTFAELSSELPSVKIRNYNDTASVDIDVGSWRLQVRVKPMNKFTTTAIKINCSVKFTQNVSP